MNKHLIRIFLWGILLFYSNKEVMAQSVINLDDCGVAYFDPQNAVNNTQPARDTLRYINYFDEENVLRSYHIDINAFGGQQVDRANVFAIMPDSSYKALGGLAFGNCSDCVEGFALVVDDSLRVDRVPDVNTMELWIQSFGQPAFSLPGNLQTLTGVGRISGRFPICATGYEVQYVVFSNPSNTTTEFSTQILCPETIQPCEIEVEAQLDCQKDSLLLSATIPTGCFSADVDITWSNGNGVVINAANAALPLRGNLGTYYLRIEDACCVIMDSVLVENPPFIDAGADISLCAGESVNFAGTGGSAHFWEFPDGSTFNDSIVSFQNIQANQSGFYIVHGFNEEGCEDVDTLQLTVNVPPIPELVVSEPCIGDSLLLAVVNEDAFSTITWLDPFGNALPRSFIADFQLENFGTYTLVAQDPFNCEIQTSFEVTGNEPPDFDFIIEESCDSTRVYLFPESYQYLWDTGDEGPIFATSEGRNYQLTITDPLGCSSVNNIEIPNPEGPGFSVRVEHPFCPDDPGTIEIVPDNINQPLIYSIDGGETYSLFPTFENLSPGNYSLLVRDDLGCIQEVTAEIIAPDTMGVELGIQELILRPTTPVSLKAETIGDIQEYQWIPEVINTQTSSTDFIANFDMDIRIIVKDARGCIASDGFQLTIVLGEIYVPNGFSPNNDGINDRFIFYSDNGSGEIIETLKVFDRYGALLFETDEVALNDESAGWDGKFEGRMMNPGVYTYFGVVRFGNNVKKTLKGDVTLMR